MNFALSEEQLAVEKSVRDFAKKEITPFIQQREKEGGFNRALFRKMGELGYFGCLFPEELGGTGRGFLTQSIIMEEFTRASNETGIGWNGNAVNVPASIYCFGTEEQKKKYIPKIISCEMMGCWSITEPDTGSDVGAIATRAIRNKDGYLVNGSKMWSTMGSEADVLILFAKTDPAAGKKGLSAFIVETANLKGYSAMKVPCTIGTNCVPTSELVFEDVQIPADALLGKEGEGMLVALHTLQFGRVCVPSRAVGLMQACLDQAVQYSKERKAFGKMIAEYQAIQHFIAEMVIYTEASRQLTRKAAWLADQGLPFGRAASIAKHFSGDAVVKCAELAMEIAGGYGVADEFPFNRNIMLALTFRVGEGAPNIQRNLIGQDELGFKKIDRYFEKGLKTISFPEV